jgi:hypothetical protein
MRGLIAGGLAAIAVTLGGCGPNEDRTYTLYRNTEVFEAARLHVATFDADYRDGEMKDYNRENCERTRSLFQGQQGVKARFWCEKGRFEE